MNHEEHEIQAAIVAYLDTVLPPGVRVVAISNNPRSRLTGALEKARGMRKGFPDLMLIYGSRCAFMEVKHERSYLRPEQREWATWLNKHGCPYAVVRSIDDVRLFLASLPINTREHKDGRPFHEAVHEGL